MRVSVQSVFLCLGALLCLFGATWLDVLGQHTSGSSAWDLVSPQPELVKRYVLDEGVEVAYRGTGLDATSIQADLTIGLNNALPLMLARMRPLYPPRFLATLGLDLPPDAATELAIAVWWVFTLAVIVTLMLRSEPRRSRASRILHKLLTAAAVVLLGGYLLTIAQPGLAVAISPLLIAMYFVAGAVFVCAPLTLYDRAEAFDGNSGANPVSVASVSALWAGAIALVALAVFTWCAVWLGWYTYDTRVNFLEPAPELLGLSGFGLSALALLTRLAIPRQAWPSWTKLAALALGGALTTQAPIPPRQTIGMDYILLNSDQVVQYENSQGTKPAIPEQSAALMTALRGGDPQEVFPLEHGAQASVGFNSANLYSHVPVGLSWMRPLLMLASLALLCACVVFMVRALRATAVTVWRALVLRRVSGIVMAVVTIGAVGYSFVQAATQLKASIASHSMARVLVLTPGPVVQSAYISYASYFPDINHVPDFARSYYELVHRLDEVARTLMVELTYARMQYFTYGAFDWMTPNSREELAAKLQMLNAALTSEHKLTKRLRQFPTTLKEALIESGVKPSLAAASRRSWERWTQQAAAHMYMQGVELSTHCQYILTLLDRYDEGLTRLYDGAVVIPSAGTDRAKLATLKLAAIRASLALERARGLHAFEAISEKADQLAGAGDAELLIRMLVAYERLFTCFKDPSAYTLIRPEGTVNWHDKSMQGACRDAAADVGKAQRGEL